MLNHYNTGIPFGIYFFLTMDVYFNFIPDNTEAKSEY
jgi:hypothetical protein